MHFFSKKLMLKILLKTCITTAAEGVVINVNFMFALNLTMKLLTKKMIKILWK